MGNERSGSETETACVADTNDGNGGECMWVTRGSGHGRDNVIVSDHQN